MTIRLSLSTSDNVYLQRTGRKLSSTMQTEAAAEEALQSIVRQRQITGRLALLGPTVSVGLMVVAGNWLPVLQGRGTFIAALVSMLVGLLSMTVWLDTADELRLRAPLASDDNLCSQLMALAERSPAVRSFIAGVNATGRQLRVFDVAYANAANVAELRRESRTYAGAACAMLHSL